MLGTHLCLEIARNIAETDIGKFKKQSYFVNRLFQIARTNGSGVNWRDVVTQITAVNAKGSLSPANQHLFEQARLNAARETEK